MFPPLASLRSGARFAAVLSLLVFPLLAPAQELVRNAAFSELTAHWERTGSGECAVNIVETDTPSGMARVLSLQPRPLEGEPPWKINMTNALGAGIPAGRELAVSFWARSPENCVIVVAVQPAPGASKMIWSKELTLTPEWKRYRFTHRTTLEAPAGEGRLQFTLGYKAGTIELFEPSIVLAD